MCRISAPSLPKIRLQIEILRLQGAAHFPGPVVMYPGAAHAEARVGDVELMPVSPGAALFHFRALIADIPAAQFALDKGRDGAVLDKSASAPVFLSPREAETFNTLLSALVACII